MKINEAFNPTDRLLAKLKGVDVNFENDENDIEYYCKNMHAVGNIRSKNFCESVINSIIDRIDLLLDIELDDDLLALYQSNASKVKDRLLILRDSL